MILQTAVTSQTNIEQVIFVYSTFSEIVKIVIIKLGMFSIVLAAVRHFIL